MNHDNTEISRERENPHYFAPTNDGVRPLRLLFGPIFVLVLIVVLVFASRESVKIPPYLHFLFGTESVSGLSIWEMVAIVLTIYLAVFYSFIITFETAKRRLDGSLVTLVIGMMCILNIAILTLGVYFLKKYLMSGEASQGYYIGYLASVFVGFVFFTLLDLFAAHGLRSYRSTREYWALGSFCDGPAAFAFAMLLVYAGLFFLQTGKVPSEQTIGGAIVMQMIIADVVYLGVATNLMFWAFGKVIRANTDQP